MLYQFWNREGTKWFSAHLLAWAWVWPEAYRCEAFVHLGNACFLLCFFMGSKLACCWPVCQLVLNPYIRALWS